MEADFLASDFEPGSYFDGVGISRIERKRSPQEAPLLVLGTGTYGGKGGFNIGGYRVPMELESLQGVREVSVIAVNRKKQFTPCEPNSGIDRHMFARVLLEHVPDWKASLALKLPYKKACSIS